MLRLAAVLYLAGGAYYLGASCHSSWGWLPALAAFAVAVWPPFERSSSGDH